MSKLPNTTRGLNHIPLFLGLAAVPLLCLLYVSKLPSISLVAPVQHAQARCLNHQYSVEIISQDPLMIYVNNFLSEEEIKWLLNKGESQYQRMLTYQGNSLSNKAVPDEGRTSYSAYLDKADPIMECIGARALDFHGGAQRALADYGNPQLVRYEPGQKVNLHYDWWQEPQNRSGQLYNRRTTILAYLEDDCTGGETYFPLLRAMNDTGALHQEKGMRFWMDHEDGQGLLVRPWRGNAVFWVNLHTNGTGDTRTLHASLPVEKGKKVAMNFWPPQYF